MTRILSIITAFLFVGCTSTVMRSPSGTVSGKFFLNRNGALSYTVSFKGETVCDTSAIGVEADGLKIYEDASLRLKSIRNIVKTYEINGVHNTAKENVNEYRWKVIHNSSGYEYWLESRLSDDGFAYRFILPGSGSRHIGGEAAQWRLPSGSKVWYAERNSPWKLLTYAGEWTSAPADSLGTVSREGPVQLMPLLYQTGDSIYLMVAEAALYNYSGMRLNAGKDGTLTADFTEKDGFSVNDTVVTPWRVLIAADNLNSLVNSDFIYSLNPDPDTALFSDTSWIRPGRSLWSWWSEINGSYMNPAAEKDVIDIASSMGYEYTTIDEGWENWPEKWKTLKEIAEYGQNRDVGIFVWKHWSGINCPDNDYAQMKSFMDSVAGSGVKGLKIDFINGESLEKVRFMETVLKNAAGRKLLINFHGCQKPSGESRKYPNELTREAVRGLELNRIAFKYLEEGNRPPEKHVPGNERQYITAIHNTILPFTRCVIGAADYTPVGFSMPGNVLPGQHVACAYLITSPLTTIAENPFIFREGQYNDAVEFLKWLPTCWDETIVLPQSEIGQFAAFARRNGNTWYIAAATADPAESAFSLDFLGDGDYRMVLLADDGNYGLRTENREVTRFDTLNISIPPCGGIVAKIEPHI